MLVFAAIIGAITAGIAVVAYRMFTAAEPPINPPLATPEVSITTEPAATSTQNPTGEKANGPTSLAGKPEKTENLNPVDTNAANALPPIEFTQYEASANSSSAVIAANTFATGLYSKWGNETSKNIFFSPYSIFSALEMTYEGARGKTADEIRSVFHFDADNATRLGSFAGLYSQINPQNASYQLSTANALWAQKDYPFYSGYLKTVETYYGGNATNLDFIANAEGSRQTINSWVSAKTNAKIPELFAKDSLDKNTRLVLTNAIYFKGKWATPFEKTATQEKDFSTAAGTKVKAQMMNRQDSFDYVETADYQAIEIPYENNDLSMVVILPRDGKTAAVESLLAANGVASIIQSMDSKLTDLFLPKFKFDTSYNMNQTLSQMGMSTAFDPDNADFTGMYDKNSANSENLYIGLVVHKAYVDVNEEGTEAAAATGVAMFAATSIMEPEQPEIFNADHPFIFAIVHNETGSILFMGKVNDPTK